MITTQAEWSIMRPSGVAWTRSIWFDFVYAVALMTIGAMYGRGVIRALRRVTRTTPGSAEPPQRPDRINGTTAP